MNEYNGTYLVVRSVTWVVLYKVTAAEKMVAKLNDSRSPLPASVSALNRASGQGKHLRGTKLSIGSNQPETTMVLQPTRGI